MCSHSMQMWKSKRMKIGRIWKMHTVAQRRASKWLAKWDRCTYKLALHRSSALVEAAAELTQHPSSPPSLVLCSTSLPHSLTVSRLLTEVFLRAQTGAARNYSETPLQPSSLALLSGSFCLHTGALSPGQKLWICGSELDHGPGRSRGRSRKLGHWQALLTDACLDLEEWGAPPARLCLMGCVLS